MVALADCHAPGVALQVVEQAAEHGRLVVGFVGLVDEIDVHYALLQCYFLDAETARVAAQHRYEQQFLRHGWNGAEAIAETVGKGVEVLSARDAVELAVKADALALLRDVVGGEGALRGRSR